MLQSIIEASVNKANRARSFREVAEFKRNPPDRVFAYYAQNAHVGEKITTWMGDVLGYVVARGREARPFGGKVVSVRVEGVNGRTYVGRANLSSGTYVRLRLSTAKKV